MIAGVRKMPLPIVEPTSTATALHRPRRRGRRSPQRSGVVTCGADMRSEYTDPSLTRRSFAHARTARSLRMTPSGAVDRERGETGGWVSYSVSRRAVILSAAGAKDLLIRLHSVPDDATRSSDRVGRGGLHLLPHRPRRARAHHRLGARLRRALAALFWPLVPAAQRRRYADRGESSA